MTAVEEAVSGGAQTLGRQQFEEFYNRTAPALRGYIRRVSGSAADDFLQESYVRLLNAPPLTEQQRKSYLYRTATNLMMDHHRAQTRQRKWWEAAWRRPEAVDSRIEIGADLDRLFLLLPAKQRALLWLAYVEQAEHHEIAAILGLAEKSVKVLLHRARVKMEAILRAHGFEGPE